MTRQPFQWPKDDPTPEEMEQAQLRWERVMAALDELSEQAAERTTRLSTQTSASEDQRRDRETDGNTSVPLFVRVHLRPSHQESLPVRQPARPTLLGMSRPR